MTQLHAMRLLSQQMPARQTILLLMVMGLARLTEGIGLLLLVPLLDLVQGRGGSSPITGYLNHMLTMFGFAPTLPAILTLFVLLVLFRSGLMFAQQWLTMRHQQQVADRLRQRLFGQLLGAEWRWLSARRTTDLVSTLTHCAGRIGAGVSHLAALVANSASLLVYAVVALLLSWPVTLFAAAGGLAVHGLMAGQRRRAVRIGQALSQANAALQAGVQEGLAGARQAKIESAEARTAAIVDRAIVRLRSEQLTFTWSLGWAQASLQVGGAALLALLLLFGKQSLDLDMSVLLTVVLVIARLIPLFSATQQSFHNWLYAVPAIDEMASLLRQSSAAAEPHSSVDLPPLPLQDAISLHDVTVRHDGRDEAALRSLTMTIKAGTVTRIAGPSGAGKSTLADLLMGLIEPDQGIVTVDNVPLTGEARHRWRRSVAYVQQDDFLFHDTVRANLAWARPEADESAMVEALRSAAAQFVLALPDGLDTVVGDSGSRLSGGERQRLALARAMLAQPALLILDEATSALDRETEMAVQATLDAMRGKVTMVIISHKPMLPESCDQLISLSGGRLSAASDGLQ